MPAKKTPDDDSLANLLTHILARLDAIEQRLPAQPAKLMVEPGSEEDFMMRRLDQLTLKRHAVLTATLGQLSYEQIASIMRCSVTTVKLHLKGALELLDIRDRSMLLVARGSMLDFISDMSYEQRYGLGKRWWLTQKPELMVVLTATKPAKNQHTAQ